MRIAILGPLRVTDEAGRPLDVGGTRLRTLLIRLALEPGQVVGADALIEAVWADQPPGGAPNALQTLVSRLRRVLPPGAVEAAPTGYRLDVPAGQVDAYRFERLAEAGRRFLAGGDPDAAVEALTGALALWRGPALADVADAGFARAAVARLTEARLAATEDAIEARLATRPGDDLTAECAELTAAHPARERPYALLMRALRDAGRPAEAVRAYHRLRAVLAEELGVDPSPDVSALYLSVLRGADEPRGNLRAPLTSFVGRDGELADVTGMLDRARLVTLVGAGGSGKTRLAVEVARRVAYPDGVWLVELAPVREPAEVPRVLAETLRLRRLLEGLAEKELLLVLDNCEHLIEECARLAETILGACPQVRILATSREPLAITGETLYPVPPLPTAPAGDPPARALTFPAVRLFADRAAAVRPGFAVTPSTVDAVAEICRRLDGLPLAIELATACLRTLPLDQVAGRLGDRFRLLTGGSRTAMPRHQTLQAVVEWSWDLLDEDQRRLARRLAVFLDGATLDSVEAVCEGDPRTLGGLVDKSFVVLAGDRYRMLETIRTFAAERLTAAGEAEKVRAAHAAYFLALAEQAEPRLRGPAQLDWLATLTAEWENLTAALRWAVDSGDAATALRLGAALGWFWSLRSAHAEAADWLTRALALPGDVPPQVRAIALVYHGLNMMATGDIPASREAMTAGIALGDPAHPVLAVAPALAALLVEDAEDAWARLPVALEHAEPWPRAVGLLLRGSLHLVTGDLDAAEADVVAGIEVFRGIGDRWGLSAGIGALAEPTALRGDNDGAIALLEESLDLSDELGVDDDMAQVLFEISKLRTRAGEFDAARAALDRAARHGRRSGVPARGFMLSLGTAELARATGDLDRADREYRKALDELGRIKALPPEWRAAAEIGVALTALAQGDPDTARDYLGRAHAVAEEQRNRPVLANVCETLAALRLTEDEATTAARLLGLAEAIRGIPDRGNPDVAEAVRQARAVLGDGYDRWYAAGAAGPVDDAIAELSLLVRSSAGTGSPRAARTPP